jgi:hypothetical protein
LVLVAERHQVIFGGQPSVGRGAGGGDGPFTGGGGGTINGSGLFEGFGSAIGASYPLSRRKASISLCA